MVEKTGNKHIEDLSIKDNNKKKLYHHGDLKECMIKTGIKLLAEEGAEKFSLRKLAAMCNVSHAAPYKHFKNKDELIHTIGEYIDKEFTEALIEVADTYKKDPMTKIIELGKKYVYFMVENKDYFKLLFFNMNEYNIKINMNYMENYDYKPFNIFRDCAVEALKYINADPDEYATIIVAMWATVHGLAIMFANNTITYDGNYLDLVEHILKSNVKL